MSERNEGTFGTESPEDRPDFRYRKCGGDPDELGRRLIDRAGELLAAEGAGALSLRKLAAAAGTSTMSVYTRFGGKAQLLAAMHREGFRRLGSELERAAAAVEEPLAALAEIGRAYRRAALESRSLYGLMFGPPVPGLELSPADEAAAQGTYQPLLAGVQRCLRTGALRGDADRIALHLWAVVHGMVSLELAGRLPIGPAAAEQAYDDALALAAAPFLGASG